MAATPENASDFISLLSKSGIVSASTIATLGELPAEPTKTAAALISRGVITKFQAKLLLSGRYKGFKLGAYFILEQIGQGGMGAVYLAEHETLKRRVALKVLTLPKDGNEGLSIERFLREARSAAALDHPNIVRLHDVGKCNDTHFIVMEYVEGQTLDQMIDKGGPITPSRAVDYIAQAAAGLQHAYERGFVHRDIKPANLILTKDGAIKILDMGLARPADENSGGLTEVMDKGAIVGTADYISPEQAMGGNVDIRSDIYSLGATFFALVTGQPPFSGNTTQKLLQHQLKDAPSVTNLDKTFPPGLSAVVSKMLSKKPESRYQTPAEVIKAVAEWLPQTAGARLSAAISGTDLARSSDMQATLSEITSGNTRRIGTKTKLAKLAEEGRSKKWFIPAVAGGILLVAVLGAIALSGSDPKADPSSAAKVEMVPDHAKAKPKTPPVKPVETKTPAPAPPSKDARLVVYQPDWSKQKTFTERGHNSVAGTGARKWWVDEKEGDGTMPAGWLMTTFKPGCIAETAVRMAEGKPILGIRCAEGENNFFIKSPTVTARTGKLMISFDYQTANPSITPLVKFEQETPNRKIIGSFTNLPATAVWDWQTFTHEVEMAPGAAGWVTFHATGTGKDYIWLRNFKIYQGGDPAERPSHDVPLYSITFNGMAIAKERFDRERTSKVFTQNTLGGREMLSSLHINLHKVNITSECQVAEMDGFRALGYRLIDGVAGIQIHSDLNDVFSYLKSGETVNVRIVYRFDGTGQGATCMEKSRGNKTKIGRWLLVPTNGQWKTIEFPFTRPEGDEPYDLIINAGNSELEAHAEGTIWLKSIEVKYADAKK